MAPLILFILTILISTAIALAYRLQIILTPTRNKPLRHGRRNPHEPTHIMIVLGSGGHTAEMLAMLSRAAHDPDAARRLDWKDFTHRTWVVGEGDGISAARVKEFEDDVRGLSSQETLMKGKVKGATDLGEGTWSLETVPRARAIHQSIYSAPLSSLACMRACYSLLTKQGVDPKTKLPSPNFPDVILCNGPATATVLVFTSVLMRLFNMEKASTRNKMRTVYVESWARVKGLSLSGRLLKGVVDRFLVQWPALERRYGGRVEYAGVLV